MSQEFAAVQSMRAGRGIRRSALLPTAALAAFLLGSLGAAGRMASSCPNNDCTQPNEWPQFQHDGRHSGYNPEEKAINVANVSKLGQQWKTASRGKLSEPIVAVGVLYVSQIMPSGKVLLEALDADTGAYLWSSEIPFVAFTAVSAPVFYQNVIYLGLSDGSGSLYVVGISAITHQLTWSAIPNVAAVSSRLAVSSGTLAVCAQSKLNLPTGPGAPSPISVLTYGTTTGALLSETQFQPYNGDSFLLACEPPAVVGTRTYYSDNHHVFSADSDLLQSPIWMSQDGYAVYGPFALGVHQVVTGGAEIRSFEYLSGALQWKRSFFGGAISAGVIPAVANGVVYAAVNDYGFYSNHGLVALDADTGESLWSVMLPASASGAPAVANGVVYLVCNGALRAYHAATGALLYQTGSSFVGTPIVTRGTVYVSGDQIYAFRPPPVFIGPVS